MPRINHWFLMLSFSILMFVSWSVFASKSAPLTLKEGAPKTYTVVKGDTLWDISALYLNSPWLWPKLWRNNPEIDNPHLIYPGDKLTLVWLNGQPVLSLKPMVKMSPKVRVLDKQAVPTLKESLVVPYLQSDRLVSLETLRLGSKVLGSSGGKKFLTSEDALFISRTTNERHWGIYRVASEFKRDNQTMVALQRIASAQREKQQEEDLTQLKVLTQANEIWLNDIALPDITVESNGLSTTFYPLPAPDETMAKILGALNGSQYSVRNQVVIIDKGSEDQVIQGSMFQLFQPGASVYQKQGKYSYTDESNASEFRLPDTSIGSLMVIRPYRYFSLALITDSKAPISSEALLVSPNHSLKKTTNTTDELSIVNQRSMIDEG
ncbi:LysM peptidoglycan-binding domain-containing protein [Vibrio genomosp. F10]|uniref:Peptidoglycan-binding protein n=3 Tax=Vibrio genomosp. F10 TaxID=723171 RepID=A0A1B9QXL3_9VIBR|nr:LysM peptidoglycan-binding domain-containing protein [Vibrio genomosp. F10]OCH74817.1 peptidoglycan-binding protein [Vibrio genomosp. F10]OEE34734.1 peptidoglycan-binding protein [Vibrio genomosp. F10 str. ZF-129]OEE93501.1 peptidoglycan-binding protein [Vibrio genomosp. F10 str. 9ZC157]